MGSMRAACRAGIQLARAANSNITEKAKRPVVGSTGDRLKSVWRNSLPTTMTPGRPAAKPMTTKVRASRNTIHAMRRRPAPRAMRIPISLFAPGDHVGQQADETDDGQQKRQEAQGSREDA